MLATSNGHSGGTWHLASTSKGGDINAGSVLRPGVGVLMGLVGGWVVVMRMMGW